METSKPASASGSGSAGSKDADDIDEKVAAAVEAEAEAALKALEAGDGSGGGGGGGGDDDGDGAVDADGKPKKKRQRTGGKGKKGRGKPAQSSEETEAALKLMLARLDHLLKRTEEIASDSSSADASKDQKESESASGSGSGSRGKKGKTGRHRMAEKEEDEKLVADELKQVKGRIVLTQPPSLLQFPPGKGMRAYQLEGLNWLLNMYERNLNGILADEMGLGKTLEAISLLAYLKEYRKISGPHMIIVPKSTISNWKRELNRWCPALKAFIFHGAKEDRPALREKLLEHDVCITTYEMAIIESAPLKKIEWIYLYIDEAHRIKNENSILSKVVRLFDSRRRLLITGTPLQNNLRELWALLNFLMPDLFDSSDDFEAWFEQTTGQADQRNQLVGRLHKILKPFLLRRMKVDVEKSLPPKVETKLFVGLSQMQLKWYTDILSKNLDALNSTGGPKMRLLNIVMQIRKVCNHPYLFDGAEPGPPYYEGDHLIENSGKMVLLDKLLKRLQEQGHRVLIFSQMTRLLDILEDYCLYRQYPYNRIDGSTSQLDRDSAMDEFNAPNSEKFIFLLSTRAGGLGINLQTADTVILYDSDWNPQMDLQAMDRAHRIGQTRQVNVYRFVSENTMEEKIIDKATRKLFLDALVIKQGRLADQEDKVSGDELQQMLRFGANQIFQTKDATITDEDIEAILKRGEERTAEENEKIKATFTDTKTFDFDKAFADAGPFVDREAPIGKQPEAKAEIDFVVVPKRERKKAFTETEYWRNALKQGVSKKPKGVFRPNVRPDFQFFNTERLQELEKKEFDAKHQMRILKDAEKAREKEERLKKAAELREEKRKAKKREAKAVSFASTAASTATATSGTDPQVAGASTASNPALPNPSPSPSPSPSPTKDVLTSEKDEKPAATAAGATATAGTTATATASSGAAGKADDADADAEMEVDAEADDDSDGENDDPNASTATPDKKGRRKSSRVVAAAQTEEEKRKAEERKAVMEEEAGCLTEAEVAEKARLERDGFGEWTRRHFQSFIRACEQFGRKKVDAISKAVEGKTPEEVKRYYHVFWKKFGEIKDSDRYIKTIEKGEARLQKVLGLQKTLQRKVDPLKKPLEVMEIPYGASAQKTFTAEEDRFIIVTVAQEGYGNWANLQLAIRSSPQFRFDWFMRSRTAADLQRRCDYLIRLLDKENEGEGGGAKRKKKADAKGGDDKKEKPKKPAKGKAAKAAAGDGDDANGDGDDGNAMEDDGAKKKTPKKKSSKAAASAASAAADSDDDKPLGEKEKGKKGSKKAAAKSQADATPKANGKKRKAKTEDD